MVKLSDGRELSADLMKVTAREHRAMRDPKQPDGTGDESLARVYGITVDELLELPYPDYWALVQEFYMASRNPLSDPNSQSASTST